MRPYVFIVILISASCACRTQQAQTSHNPAENKADSISNHVSNFGVSENNENTNELVETFTNDSNIGVPHRNKIELSEFRKSQDNSVQIKFYSLSKDGTWKLKQTFELVKYGGLSCDMQIKDFNGDGFKDVTYISGIAARGANEIRNLLIYDKSKDELVYIKNSGDYPNLLYNKTLNCIDSQIFTGSSATVFLKIDGDVLKEFASVETSNTVNDRHVYLIDINGKKRLLRTDKISEDDLFERYKTFNPPRAYTAKELEQ
jgi:hypothetical protein